MTGRKDVCTAGDVTKKHLIKHTLLSGIMQLICLCTLPHTHTARVTSGQGRPSWTVPDNPYVISCRVTGSISPEVSTCQTISSQKGPTRRANLLTFAKTHTSSSSSVSILVNFIFFGALYQGLRLGSCDKTKGSSAITGSVAQQSVEQHLTLCTHFESFKRLHAVSFQSGTPLAALKQKTSLKNCKCELMQLVCAVNSSTLLF